MGGAVPQRDEGGGFEGGSKVVDVDYEWGEGDDFGGVLVG